MPSAVKNEYYEEDEDEEEEIFINEILWSAASIGELDEVKSLLIEDAYGLVYILEAIEDIKYFR